MSKAKEAKQSELTTPTEMGLRTPESDDRAAWHPEMEYEALLERALCLRTCGHREWGPNDPRHTTDDSYELGKGEWKLGVSLLGDLRDADLMLVKMPPCRCGEPFGAGVHDNIVGSTDPDWRREQHHVWEPTP